MSSAEVESMAALQLFTLGGSGGMPPPPGNFDDFMCSRCILLHSEAYREVNRAS